MTTIYRQLKQQLPIKLLTIDVLFALRLLFDRDDDIVDLDADINDLHDFPDRLFSSYRPEWEAYVTRAIAAQLQQDSTAPVTQLVSRMLEDVDAIIAGSPRYARLYPIVVQAKAIHEADNTLVFPTPWRQQITALLLPVSTLYKPNS